MAFDNFRFFHGLEANLPLATPDRLGEPAYTTDTNKLFVCDGASWVQMGAGGVSIPLAWANVSKTGALPSDVGADAAGAASAVQGNLNTHTGLTTTAHGGIVASTDARLTDARTPLAHSFVDTTGHTASGLTTGNFLKATGATTYAFSAHGLTYPDVGADAAGAAATVQGNLNTHAGLTTAHGSTNLNTASAIVQRDASGDFSAGTITVSGINNLSQVATAYVETTGNDSSAALGRIDKPFLTINAALDALPSTGGVVKIGIGTFGPITGDDAGGSSKLKDYVSFVGSKQPTVNAGVTGLENGTIIQGPLVIDRPGIKLSNLGVDSGSDVCTALYGGTAQEGIEFANIGQVVGKAQRSDIVVKNVTSLLQSASTLHHAMLFENLIAPDVENVVAVYGNYGVVFKAVNGTVANLRSIGHNGNGLFFKSDNYAPCSKMTASNVYIGPVAAGDTGGMSFQAVDGSIGLSGITVNGYVADATTADVTIAGGTTASVSNISVNGMVSPGVSVGSHSGLYDATTILINGHLLNGNIGIPNLSAYLMDTHSLITGNTNLNDYFFCSAGNATLSGVGNYGMGNSSLTGLTSGTYNFGIGPYTLVNLTTGSFNVAIGTTALYSVASGSSGNIGIGTDAGYNSGVTYYGINNCTFIGREANSSADSVANSSAFGYQAQIIASNQVVIGNASVTDVYAGSVSAAATVHAAGFVGNISGGTLQGTSLLVGTTAFAGYGTAPIAEIRDISRTSADGDGGTVVLLGTSNTTGGGAALALGSNATAFYATFGRIRAVKDNNTSGQYGGGLVLETRANGAGLAPAITILSNKNVNLAAGFGCNGAAAQTAYASGGAAGAVSGTATSGGYGFASAAEFNAAITAINAAITLTNNHRTALVNDGIES